MQFKWSLEKTLVLGVITRIIVFIFLSPCGNDPHIRVINYLLTYHRLPISEELGPAFHPPLYYIFVAPFGIFGNEKIIQFFSLLLSIATLFIFYVLIKNATFMKSSIAKTFCLLLPSLLPSLIMFSSYISNDGISFFWGALIFLQMYFILSNSSYVNQVILVIYLGLGLSIKGTFVPFILPILVFIFMINLRNDIATRKIIGWMICFILLIFCLGSYKYIENLYYYGQPFIHGLDFKHIWADMQRPTYQSFWSFINIDISKLIIYPTVSDYTRYSAPLMLYATFWYQYIPESNFMGNLTVFKYLGSLIYVLAIVPTLFFIIGFFRIICLTRYFVNFRNLSKDQFNSFIYQTSLLFIFLINVIIVLYLGIKYDVWSCFQSRLFYASYFAILIFFYQGFEYIKEKFSYFFHIFYLLIIFLYICFIFYFVSEIVGQIFYKYFSIPNFLLFK